MCGQARWWPPWSLRNMIRVFKMERGWKKQKPEESERERTDKKERQNLKKKERKNIKNNKRKEKENKGEEK